MLARLFMRNHGDLGAFARHACRNVSFFDLILLIFGILDQKKRTRAMQKTCLGVV